MAETKAVIFSDGKFQGIGNSGEVVPYGKLYFFESTSGNQVVTYTTSTMETENTFPIILSASGKADVYVGDGQYDVTLQDKNGTTVWTINNYIPAGGQIQLEPVASVPTREEFTGIVGSSIILDQTPLTTVIIHKNGLLLKEAEYSLDGRTITFTTPLIVTDEIIVEFSAIVTEGVNTGIIYDIDTISDLLDLDISYETTNVKGYYSINDGGGDIFNYSPTIDKSTANGGTIFDPDQTLSNQGIGVGNGCWIRQLNGKNISVDDFGAVGDQVADDTDAFQRAIDSFIYPFGGVIEISDEKRYLISSITIKPNITLTANVINDENTLPLTNWYDDVWGGSIYMSGSVTLGRGATIKELALLNANLVGTSAPASDGEANTLVGNFSGTAILGTDVGTQARDLIIIGFDKAFVDSSSRHRLRGIRFDCTDGIEVGGGSDLTRLQDCHAWPYLTARLGLSTSVNYRSGTAYKVQNNADKFTLNECYSFGHEIGFHFKGQAGQIVQSCSAMGISADSGNIGTSGTSIGIYADDYVADLDIYEPQTQNNDINMKVNTRGADTGGGDRLDKVKFHGGKSLEPSSKFLEIINGYVLVDGVSFQKGSTSTICIDWQPQDGGVISNCDFEEMYSASGAGEVVKFASDTVDKLVVRINNKQEDTIHVDNRFDANSVESLTNRGFHTIASSGTVTISADIINIVGSYHLVDTEAAAATDNLSTINGGINGAILILRTASSTRDVTLLSGIGNILLDGGVDFTLDSATDRIMLQLDTSIGGGTWLELSRSSN